MSKEVVVKIFSHPDPFPRNKSAYLVSDGSRYAFAHYDIKTNTWTGIHWKVESWMKIPDLK